MYFLTGFSASLISNNHRRETNMRSVSVEYPEWMCNFMKSNLKVILKLYIIQTEVLSYSENHEVTSESNCLILITNSTYISISWNTLFKQIKVDTVCTIYLSSCQICITAINIGTEAGMFRGLDFTFRHLFTSFNGGEKNCCI